MALVLWLPPRGRRGLIVDVRLNGGGSEPLAQKVAARFVTRETVYEYSRYRAGPGHEDLGPKNPRSVRPAEGERYEGPVLLLIGERCMSSNESFIAMMAGGPQVTTMGARTCGSSGNPKAITLPASFTVTVPRWIAYLADGHPLDERGITPQVPFAAPAEAFQGERDDLLAAALEKLRSI